MWLDVSLIKSALKCTDTVCLLESVIDNWTFETITPETCHVGRWLFCVKYI